MIGGYGEVLVMDWGLAKILKKEASGGPKVRSHREELGRLATRQGEAIGTPGYMPPELALGQLHLVDERSDVFSLGAILYEMLTLRRPYAGREATTILQKMLRQPVQLARQRAPERNIPLDLEDICARCLQRDVSKRFDSVLELNQAIQRHLESRAEPADRTNNQSPADLENQVEQYMQTVEREGEVRRALDLKRAEVPPWASLDDRREGRRLAQAQRELDEQARERFARAYESLQSRLILGHVTAMRGHLGQVAARVSAMRSIERPSWSSQCRRILSGLNLHPELLR